MIEIRPVISGGSGGNRMKCRRCKAPAVVEIRRHNAAFCADCFLRHVREQVKRAIDGHDMFEPSDRILVAVSGGKDSLALWDVLLELGYRADGLYLGLGIGEYSERSHRIARAFARRTRRAPRRGRPGARLRVRRADRRQEGLAVDLRGLRPVQALRVQPRRARGRVRRDRDRPQPGRRGRDAARQHAAVADRLHRAPVPGAAGGGGVRAQGQAAVPALGARDRRVRVPARDRLRRGGVPARGREHAAPVQGRDEPPRIDLARDEGPVPLRLPGPGRAAVRDAGRGRARRVRAMRPAHDRQVLRVLPRAGADPGRAARRAAAGPESADETERSRDRRGAVRRGHAGRDLRDACRDDRAVRGGGEDPAGGPARPPVPPHAPDRRDLALPRRRRSRTTC